jgi:hypothetical protein
VLIFLDGVGIGPNDPTINPWLGARLPCLRALLGGQLPTLDEPRCTGERALLVPADATLGMPGLPQSGTGQTALLTGVNTAALFARHFGPWVPTPLRALLAERNLLVRALGVGKSAAFANAYHAREPGKRPAAPTLAAHAAGLLVHGADALREGRAVASSITSEMWQRFAPDAGVPDVSPREAGRTLAGIAAGVDLTLFAHYDTDFAGHRRGWQGCVAALERVDAFLGGVLELLPEDALVVIASDHGNLEDTRAGHTRNPVPVVAIGPGRAVIADWVTAITDVAPAILQLHAKAGDYASS